jgi:hypothetical protein
MYLARTYLRLVRMKSYTPLPQSLMYHSISRPEGDYDALCTSPGRFENQMLYLKRHNLRGVSMKELLLAMSAGDSRGLVGITFDDGYEDFLSAALPTLEGLGFSATVFVVAGMLGKENTWEHRGVPRLQLRLLEAIGRPSSRARPSESTAGCAGSRSLATPVPIHHSAVAPRWPQQSRRRGGSPSRSRSCSG